MTDDMANDVTDDQPTGSRALDAGDESLLALVDRLATLLDRSDLSELEVEVGGTGLILRKPAPPAAPLVVTAAASAATIASEGPLGGTDASLAQVSATVVRDAATAARPAVRAPLTGIYWGAPSPGSAPYLQVGGEVAVGQVVGLIEAMKLFNEIKSDLAGRVVRIVAEDGQLVKAKQPLIEVEPL